MKYLILFFLLINYSFAQIKLLNFNTMCDLCSDSHFNSFNTRLRSIKKTIHNHNADLISLQELRLKSHFNFLFAGYPHYKLIHHDNWFAYTDSVLAVNTNKFQIINSGHFWLGPKTNCINLGWKAALPRIVVWTHIKEIKTGQPLLFVGSHFDNRIENLEASAKLISNFVKTKTIPIIFAADTNITTDMPAFGVLSQYLSDTFQPNFDVVQPTDNSSHLCYSRKGDEFPACKVEHIMMSKNSPWKIKKMTIDNSNYSLGNLSDHKIFIVELE